jgi:hypothetical protein
MIPANQRHSLLAVSGRLVKYFFIGLLSFAVVLILFSCFGQMSVTAILLTGVTPYLFKGFITIVCFGFMSVVFESLS